MIQRINQLVQVVQMTPNPEKLVDLAASVCYRRPPTQKGHDFFQALLKRGHRSVFEHVSASFLLDTSRMIANELTRHRVGVAISQESTRYVSYKDCLVVIGSTLSDEYLESVHAEYCSILATGDKERAREVLPLCTATKLMFTANVSEWRHILTIRNHPAAAPDMQALMQPILTELVNWFPGAFVDLCTQVH